VTFGSAVTATTVSVKILSGLKVKNNFTSAIAFTCAMEMIKMAKTITVKDETHTRLRNAGISGESMDVIINRLLDEHYKEGGENANR
jgi:hypothetical protein